MGGKVQRLLHPKKNRLFWQPASSAEIVPSGVVFFLPKKFQSPLTSSGFFFLAQRFPSALTLKRILCIIWSLIKRFDRFTRPRRQGSQVWLSFSQENSRGCFI